MRFKSKTPALLLLIVAIGLFAVACTSDATPTAAPAPTPTPSPTATAVPTAAPTSTPEDTRVVRPIPDELLNTTSNNKNLEISILVNAWNDYLDDGTLISLDGEHTMEMCAFHGNYWIRATGSIAGSNGLGARLMFESPEWGWPGPGIVFEEIQRSNYVTGYLLEIHDGTPTLVWNPNATHGFTLNEAVWQEPVVDNVQFEVVESELDCGFNARLEFLETYPPGWN